MLDLLGVLEVFEFSGFWIGFCRVFDVYGGVFGVFRGRYRGVYWLVGF